MKINKKYVWGGLIILAIIAGFVFFAPSNGSNVKSTQSSDFNTTFTTIDGEEVQLSEYRGQKVMLWVFATWCPSCQQGARSLQRNNEKLKNVKILAVKTHGNAGSPGSSPSQFAQQYAPQTLNKDNWVWGKLSRKSTQKWNPNNSPDVYYLIDENGNVKTSSTAPAATIDQIINFAQNK